MLLLQDQFDLKSADQDEKLQRFGEFVTAFYSSLWPQSPLAPKAAFNDLQFNTEMLECQPIPKFQKVADAIIHALNRCLWYPTEKLVSYPMCSKQLEPEIKEILGCKSLR